jgi:5,5'-dehydrodivanillate O-demethylase
LRDGWVDEQGIRCPYHGWYFNGEGRCLAQPYDDLNSSGTFKDRVFVTAYPVQELGGLLWAYLGPEPVPLLPRWKTLVGNADLREIGFTVLGCNWMQIAENTMDPVHVEWLHVNQANHLAAKRGDDRRIEPRRHLKVDFTPFEYGIYKRRLMEGDPEDSPDWTTGHPLLFPGHLAQEHQFQFRTPIDDTHTLHILYTRHPAKDGGAETVVTSKQISIAGSEEQDDSLFAFDSVLRQDFAVWLSQGPVAPRHLESLGRSDRGIVMYRMMLRQAIEAVERGEDPIGTIRDPAVNDPWVPLNFEGENSTHKARLLNAVSGASR